MKLNHFSLATTFDEAHFYSATQAVKDKKSSRMTDGANIQEAIWRADQTG